MKLIIVRHGETIENKEGIIMGHLHGKLSDLGIEQAKKVAQRLKDEDIDYIFSSDLDRATNTAREVAKFHSVSPKFVKELRERYLGNLQGKKNMEIDWEKEPPNSKTAEEFELETLEELFNRAKGFLEEIYKRYEGKTILLVGHDGINRALISNILKKSADYITDIDSQSNTAVSIIELKDNQDPILHLINDIKHLEE